MNERIKLVSPTSKLSIEMRKKQGSKRTHKLQVHITEWTIIQ